MPSHWTYCEFEPDDDLAQGDILERTDALVDLMNQVHAHFCDEKYLGFLVVTNSCDLVSRDTGRCKAHYVTLAVIRAFDALLPSLLNDVCRTDIPGVYNLDFKGKAAELLQRILNQNEQALGLFYLHPDADSGIAVPSIALLRVKISFRAEHYPLLTAARVGRLDPTFSSKLGWLAGNLYSRVATPDWNDREGGSEQLRQNVSQLLSTGTEWVSGKWIKNAAAGGLNLSTLTASDAKAKLAAYAPADRKITVLHRVHATATTLFPDDVEGKVRKLVERLKSDAMFQDAFK